MGPVFINLEAREILTSDFEVQPRETVILRNKGDKNANLG